MKKNKDNNGLLSALVGGLAGACALTLVHETVRRLHPDAPRMDVLGMRAIAQGLRAAGQEPPAEDKLFNWTMAGDLVANSLYYSLAGCGKNALLTGSVLGMAAGIGGITLPGPLGLGTEPSSRTPQTTAMTVAWYVLGGLVAGAVTQGMSKVMENKK